MWPGWFQILSADGSDRTLPEGKGELGHLRGHFPRGSESHQDLARNLKERFLD